MVVTPLSCEVPALMDTNSRMTFSSPIKVRVGSPVYFRSCGISPIDAKAKTRLLRPSVVRPARTTCAPMTLPSPTVTSGPTTVKGPISTPAAIFAPAATIAEGCARILGLEFAQRSQQLGFRNQRLADAGAHRKFADAAHQTDLGRLQQELVARTHLALETGVVEPGEKDQRLAVRAPAQRLVDQNHRNLRQRLDNHDAGHYRIIREVALKERLVDGDVLDRLDGFARHAFEHSVNQKAKIPMRQGLHDLVDVHFRHDYSLPSLRSSARMRSANVRSRRMTDATCRHSRCGSAGKALV